MSDKSYITKNGYERLQRELKALKTVERPAISQAIAEARELGDLKENAEYHAAREKQSFIEGRVIELENIVATAEIIDVSALEGNAVKFGATVTVFDEDTEQESVYTIVGEYEADLDKGMISLKSPVARALIGKRESDTAVVETPRGKKHYEIVSVRFDA